MATLRSWYRHGRSRFVARLAGIGAVAGLVAWGLSLLIRGLLGREPPGMTVLVFAVLRGALFGAILAIILAAYWDWAARRRGATRRG